MGRHNESVVNGVTDTFSEQCLDQNGSQLLRLLRRKAGKIHGMPAEVMAHIDAALALLNNEKAVAHLEFSSSRDRLLA